MLLFPTCSHTALHPSTFPIQNFTFQSCLLLISCLLMNSNLIFLTSPHGSKPSSPFILLVTLSCTFLILQYAFCNKNKPLEVKASFLASGKRFIRKNRRMLIAAPFPPCQDSHRQTPICSLGRSLRINPAALVKWD